MRDGKLLAVGKVPTDVPVKLGQSCARQAAVNGIPAVANRIGGIPEAMGSSGILVDFNPGSIDEPELDRLAHVYAREVEKIFRDPGLYTEFSRKARLRAEEYAGAQAITSRRHYEKYFSR
jgi:glycosyltransferase involved in cell wall biosynthesis